MASKPQVFRLCFLGIELLDQDLKTLLLEKNTLEFKWLQYYEFHCFELEADINNRNKV